ncbi:MAG: hypothetical protein ACKPE3_15535 [Sphaerospermopsis kisseleviana]
MGIKNFVSFGGIGMDEHIDQKIFDLFPKQSQIQTGLTWEEIRKIAEPDSRIATRLRHLQEAGKIKTVTLYILEND